MWLSTAASYVRLSLYMFRLNLQAIMEYRVSFVMQVFGMILNDISLVLLWYIFFERFESVNGWTFRDNMLLLALSTSMYGTLMLFGRGAFDIAKMIHRGEMDYFLTMPRNVLWQATVSKVDISGLGDLTFGFLIFLIFEGFAPAGLILFMFVCACTTLILYSFLVLTQSLTFFFGNLEDAADNAFWAMFSFSFYPQTVFHGWLKLLMFTAFPGFFIAAMPVFLLKEFTWYVLLLLSAFSTLLFALAYMVFHRGLAKYESGNAMLVRV